MKRIILLSVFLLCFLRPALAQRNNTFDVAAFPGSTVAVKVIQAQAQCNLNYTCVIVFDPILAGYEKGALPAKCASCYWLDYSGAFGGLIGSGGTGSGGSGGVVSIPYSLITGITGTPNGAQFLRDDWSWQPLTWNSISAKPYFFQANGMSHSLPGTLAANAKLLDYRVAYASVLPANCGGWPAYLAMSAASTAGTVPSIGANAGVMQLANVKCADGSPLMMDVATPAALPTIGAAAPTMT